MATQGGGAMYRDHGVWRVIKRTAVEKAVAAVLLLLLAACSGVEVDVHPAADFTPARYGALAWASPPLGDKSPPELRELERTVRKSVEKGLVARGYSLAAAGAAPDLLIDYRWSRRIEPQGAGSVSPSDEAARVYDLDSTPAGDSALYRHPTLDVAERVNMRVSLRDAATRELVWWGSAEMVAPDGDESAQQRQVDKLIGHLLRELPKR